jgi:predicted 2-oxoglutarate/Fe(II)-dependent dioxygenase YbiX
MKFDSPPLFALADNVISPSQKSKLLSELEILESEPAGLANWDGTRSTDSHIRRSQNTSLESGHWLQEHMFEQVKQLNEQLWEMRLLKPERVQILNYSPGDHYIWHFDVLSKEHADTFDKGSNRILSAVLNLSDESEYTMGDLMFHDPLSGTRSPGLHGCGNMVVAPSNHWHRATTITSGSRRVAVMWVRGRLDQKENNYIADFTKTMSTATPTVKDIPNSPKSVVGVSSNQGLIVYRPYSNSVYVLSGIAGWIWEAQASKKIPSADLVEELSSHFGIDSQQIQSDVEQIRQSWNNAEILPDENSALYKLSDEKIGTSVQYYNITSTLIQIDYDDSEVEKMLRPLLQPLEINTKAIPKRKISVNKVDQGHAVRIDLGQAGVTTNAPLAVKNILSELHSMIPVSSGVSLCLGAGGLGQGNQAIIMPGLLNPGRVGLLYAMSKHYGYDFLASCNLPFHAGNSTVEAMPMPLKLRKHDLDLISEQLTEDEPNVQSGTVSDVIKLVPAPRITKDGRRYRPAIMIFAHVDTSQQTVLTEIDSITGLSKLMNSGSYFVENSSYEGVMQIFAVVEKMPVYELRFKDLNSAFEILDPVLKATFS